MLRNPLKNFTWEMEVDGVVVGGGYNDLLQDIQLPTGEYTVATHGAAGNQPDLETPNKINFTDMVMTKLVRNDNPDNDFWIRLGAALTGVPEAYMFNFTLREKNKLGQTIRTYVGFNAWCKSLEPSNKVASNEDADNATEIGTFFVQQFYPEPIQAFRNAFEQ